MSLVHFGPERLVTLFTGLLGRYVTLPDLLGGERYTEQVGRIGNESPEDPLVQLTDDLTNILRGTQTESHPHRVRVIEGIGFGRNVKQRIWLENNRATITLECR